MASARARIPGGGRALTSPDRPSLLERVDDAAVVQLYADGFADLSPSEQVLAYHLYRAAIAGRDIYYDQRYAPSLEMRAVLEAVVRHEHAIDAGTFEQIHRYTKLFWLNSGPHNNLTARKFVLRCEPAAFDEAVRAAARDGGVMPMRPGESIDGLLARLRPLFFDAELDAIVTNKSPKDGQDLLLASANNLYAGVSLADLEGFDERYALNSRLVKRDGRLVEEVYRVGGRYDAQIAAIVSHLEDAVPCAPPATRDALQALIRCYRTGAHEDRERYDTAWVLDRHATVDTINGFIEVYLDARGMKAAWESAVFYVNREKTDAIRTLAREAQWFEDRMPFDPAYRKAGVTGVTANAIDVIVEAGDSGPVTPVGINLPNDDRIRAEYGSKSVSMSNVMDAYERSMPQAYWSEFAWTPEEAGRAAAWSRAAGELSTNMHEVIGHASGQSDPRLGTSPQAALRETYSTVEEARADLVALYFISHPHLAALGLVPAEHHAEIVRAEYEAYARNALVQLRRIREGTVIEEDHMRNRQLIVRWLMANTRAVLERWRDGRTFYVVVDPQGVHDGVARLLAEVQRIKSQGDYAAAKALVDTYGVHFDAALRDEVVARVQRIDLPSYTGFVMPRLTAARDGDGQVARVDIDYPLDLTAQMLEYSETPRR
jgi:dipeptidyl-peptidase III